MTNDNNRDYQAQDAARVTEKCSANSATNAPIWRDRTIGKLLHDLEAQERTVNALCKQCDSLQQTNCNLERTRQVTADGLMIERDELLIRARRLEMRIRGLGFDV